MTTCGLGVCAFGRQCIQGDGPIPARYVLIGEAPGVTELNEGRPFVGRAGRLLDECLREAELNRADIRVTNACGCVDLEREDRRPLPAELDACRPRLDLEIELCEPRVILLMGNTALQRYFPGERIGRVYDCMRCVDGTVIIPTYHPAHVLRGNAQVRPIIVDALRNARRLGQ